MSRAEELPTMDRWLLSTNTFITTVDTISRDYCIPEAARGACELRRRVSNWYASVPLPRALLGAGHEPGQDRCLYDPFTALVTVSKLAAR